MSNREITGAMVRVERDGRWQPVDITDLSDKELDKFFDGPALGRERTWIRFLVAWIRGHQDRPAGPSPWLVMVLVGLAASGWSLFMMSILAWNLMP